MQSSNLSNDLPINIATLDLLGGWLCLDFVNTVDPRVGDHPHEFLSSYTDLVLWSRHVGILPEGEVQDLLQEAARHPTEATVTFEHAIMLRETIYRVFSSIARKTIPQSADLEAFRNAFAEVMTHAQLTAAPDGFAWTWNKHENSFNRILWPIVRSAIELLTSGGVIRVKECPGLGDCGWLFLDTSKNGSRQWCSMESCGSRAKMRRQYARKRVARSRKEDDLSTNDL